METGQKQKQGEKQGHKKCLEIKREIGKGSYGNVYAALDGNGKQVAVKVIEEKEDGISSLLELSIMSVIQHPNINSALYIKIKDERIYIVQELAIGSLSKNFHLINDIRKCLFDVTEAVYCLHQESIIHCDIKCDNILVFEDGRIKLADFGLSKLHFGTPFKSNRGTKGHKAPEMGIGNWEFAADIWSLGCTYHEIVYRQTPFPSQPETDKGRAIMNCFMDYDNRYNSGKNVLNSSKFVPYVRNKDWDLEKNKEINVLISLMLQLNPVNRPEAGELIDHPYFELLSCDSHHIEIISDHEVKEGAWESFISEVFEDQEDGELDYGEEGIIYDENVSSTAKKIYGKYMKEKKKFNPIVAYTCLHIANKMIKDRPLEEGSDCKYSLTLERKICKELGFKLHI